MPQTPMSLIGLKADNLWLNFDFHNKCDKIEASESATTLLSANKTPPLYKLNMNIGKLGANSHKFILVGVKRPAVARLVCPQPLGLASPSTALRTS